MPARCGVVMGGTVHPHGTSAAVRCWWARCTLALPAGGSQWSVPRQRAISKASPSPGHAAQRTWHHRALASLLGAPSWSSDDKSVLRARIHRLLAALPPADLTDSEHLDDDLEAASESQLFAILDDELGR